MEFKVIDLTTYEEFRKDEDMIVDFCDFFFHFKPHAYQKKFLNSCIRDKRIAGKWPRQSGKSQTVAIFCAFITMIKPTNIMITAPTQNQSNELFSKVRTLMLGHEAISSQITKSTQTELILKNGSRIKALPTGAEGKSIRGFTADIIIIEEAGVMEDDIINSVITPMIASKKDEGQIIKIGTPLTKNHFYRSCFVDTNYSVINVVWEDCVKAGQYSQEFIDEQKGLMVDTQFRCEYCAEFIEEIASFFPLNLISSSTSTYPMIDYI